MSHNHWEQFSRNFEAKNNYVVGEDNVRRIKQRLSAITSVGKLLELGCGNGTYTECFVEQATSVTATDLSDAMLAVTAQRFENEPKVHVEKANCFFLPYKDDTFDTVFMANLLHVIPNQERALMEVRRVLKPAGRLYILSYTQHEMSLWERCKLRFRYTLAYRTKPRHAIVLTPSLTESFCRAAGFNEVQCQMLGSKVKAVFAQVVTT
ncbi:class I SAM-dependent methyltransferase [Vibrio sp. V39_P1S14PM300]|uniref:class I SAM-dependent methyltransferase n=1 Tax=Vibrio sp. V39_P1S14PM300 TaxID=1938690 RepID=UPI001372AEDD|nr:class I SAM-dependent methyltransferase [Vibrio sp. V39_P1S14PM300]NAX19755.1 methyltransferase domain-containing protein [Vibrio sp. V39_P1S14PM300]